MIRDALILALGMTVGVVGASALGTLSIDSDVEVLRRCILERRPLVIADDLEGEDVVYLEEIQIEGCKP